MEMKHCASCEKDLPATTEYFYPLFAGHTDRLQVPCKRCKSVNRKRKILECDADRVGFTTREEREANPMMCIAVDALVLAVNDHKDGRCEPDFWQSDMFDLLCDVAGLHPEYYRRVIYGRLGGEVPTQEGMIYSGT